MASLGNMILKKKTLTLKSFLVGGFNPSEKYEFVSWGCEIPNINGES